MDATIAGILALDGLTNGAIYALLALATVLVFAVTRVIFIPQGEFVAFGALTLALRISTRSPARTTTSRNSCAETCLNRQYSSCSRLRVAVLP